MPRKDHAGHCERSNAKRGNPESDHSAEAFHLESPFWVAAACGLAMTVLYFVR
jgi:hypothetical protein